MQYTLSFPKVLMTKQMIEPAYKDAPWPDMCSIFGILQFVRCVLEIGLKIHGIPSAKSKELQNDFKKMDL